MTHFNSIESDKNIYDFPTCIQSTGIHQYPGPFTTKPKDRIEEKKKKQKINCIKIAIIIVIIIIVVIFGSISIAALLVALNLNSIVFSFLIITTIF